MTLANWVVTIGIGTVIFSVSCFACYMTGYWRGEKQAGRLFHEMQVINSPSRAYAQVPK